MSNSSLVLVPLLLVFFLAPAPVNTQCTDQDAVVRQVSKQQFGAEVTCAEFLKFEQGICDDAALGKLCCLSCKLEDERERALWIKYASEQAMTLQQLQQAPQVMFRGGGSMPPLALGCAFIQGQTLVRTVEYALRSGYRALDSALMYRTQRLVAEGMRRSGVPREDIFLISKVPEEMQGFEATTEAVNKMLDEFQTSYVDLCLIHWPNVNIDGPDTDAFKVVERAATWRALEAAKKSGKCTHIGVSNYMRKHLEELLDYAREMPAVNQIEFHPYQVDESTLAFCRKYGIVVQAYGTLSSGGILDDPVVKAVAAEHGRSGSQILLRWSLQEGTTVIPRSSKPARLLDNARLWDFTLSSSQQQRLTSLHRAHRSYGDPHAAPVGNFAQRRPWHKWRLRQNRTD